MKQTSTLIYLTGLIVLAGCKNKSSKETYTYPSNNTYAPSENSSVDTTIFNNNNPTFNKPSYDDSQIQYK